VAHSSARRFGDEIGQKVHSEHRLPVHREVELIVLFAGQQPSAIGMAAAIAGGIVLLVMLGAFALWLFRGYEGMARAALKRAFEDLDIHAAVAPRDVVLKYHTYHGFLAWGTETAHTVILPPEDARKLLGRLLRFNLSWGLAAHGGILVPPLAVGNYIAQRRSITRQERAAALAPAGSTAAAMEVLKGCDRPSLFRRVIAWLMLCLCVLFAISGVYFLATRRFDAGLGGGFLALLLGWLARSWLRHPGAGRS
jgi:hypothetical protein